MVPVSVIILNYNTFALTCAAIQSVIERTKGVAYEIILVDNGSAECDAENFKERYPQIKLIKSSTNLGFARGNNLGVQQAQGRCLLLLNSDTVLMNDAITIAYQKLTASARIGVVGAQLQFPDGELQHSAQRFPEISYLLIELLRLQKLLPKKLKGRLLLGSFFDHASEVEADWVWGTFFMFKREILQHMQGHQLPDDFFMYNEDLQWGIETKRAGYKTVFLPAAKVVHYEGKNKFKSQMAEDNFRIIMDRYYGKWYHRLYRLLHKAVINTSLK